MVGNNIIKMYDLVFEDIVKCRLEDMNYDLEENEILKTLTDSEIKKIAHNLIYKNDYMWEHINEEVDYYINYTIKNRKGTEVNK